jgi:hypothetical protein
MNVFGVQVCAIYCPLCFVSSAKSVGSTLLWPPRGRGNAVASHYRGAYTAGGCGHARCSAASLPTRRDRCAMARNFSTGVRGAPWSAALYIHVSSAKSVGQTQRDLLLLAFQ